jgi:Fe-S cluster assembly ATP-binding protein
MKKEIILELADLYVSVGGKEILKGVNLKIRKGEVHAIFGPNGSGKTTLLNAIMGFSDYNVSGKVVYRGEDITNLPINERAKRGSGMYFQRPPSIRGVTLKQLIETNAKRNAKLIEDYAERLNLVDFLERNVNVGFSGGEIKRAELLQLICQDPDVVFLDEPDSGVDLESIALIGEFINHLLGKKKVSNTKRTIKELYGETKKTGLIIPHTGHILEYVNVDVGHVLLKGEIACRANPREVLHTILVCGFEE